MDNPVPNAKRAAKGVGESGGGHASRVRYETVRGDAFETRWAGHGRSDTDGQQKKIHHRLGFFFFKTQSMMDFKKALVVTEGENLVVVTRRRGV